MYTHILVPTDGSPLSDYGVEQALALAAALKAKATLFTTVEPFQLLSYSPEQIAETRDAYERYAKDHAEQCLQKAQAKAEELGVSCQTQQVSSDDPHVAIIEAAREHGCDLIAMASHGRRGVKALVLGSVTAKVLTHSQIPVLVYRKEEG